MYKVLFVCLGNICRSPAAEVIFNAALQEAGLEGAVTVDSCGTANYHTGQKPDRRMLAALERAGYTYGGHRARQFSRADFERFDLIIPQDESNRHDLMRLARNNEEAARIVPMRKWFAAEERRTEVPDPYYDGSDGFDDVVRLLGKAARNLAADIQARLQQQA